MSPAIGSAQSQPRVALRISPTSSTAERYVQSSVWAASATTALEPRALPVRRCAQERNGMTSNEEIASPIPTGEGSGLLPPISARADSKAT